jgi:hypothetical protein
MATFDLPNAAPLAQESERANSRDAVSKTFYATECTEVTENPL